MPMNILMPALSPTMETGTLAKWLVKEGENVKAGQVLAEIETDKATMEFETADEGTIARLLIPAGADNVAVGTVIAVLLAEGEAPSAAQGASPVAPITPPPSAPPAAVSPPPPVGTAPPRATAPSSGRVAASPLARRLAAQANLDLAQLKGSGPGGRIVKADVLRGGAPSPAPSAPTGHAAPLAQAASAHSPPYEETKLSTMRKVIAQRLTASKQTIPHIYLTIECVIDALLQARQQMNAKLSKQGVKLSVNDFVIRATALALKEVPAANVQFAGDMLRQFHRVDIAVAVALPNGLVTPVIRDAGNKGLAVISKEMAALADKARAGKLMPEDYADGTFSISNMGMYGIQQFDAVINPPQAGILAIGSGTQRPVVKDGALAVATAMHVTGSFDHRVIDGAVGAEFLAAFKGFIEDPMMMLA